MARVPYTYRRGAIYYWRRRVPGLREPITISLGTADPRLAQTLSLILAGASATIITANGFAGMNHDQAQTFLREALVAQRERVANIERVRIDAGEAWEEERRATRAAAIAFSLLADRGRSAQLTQDEAADLAGHPDGRALLRQVEVSLDCYRAMHWSDSATLKLKRQLSDRFGSEVSAADIDEGRRLKLRAFAMASGAVASEVRNPFDLAALAAVAAELQNVTSGAAPKRSPEAPADAPAVEREPPSLTATAAKREIPVEDFGAANIRDLVQRLITDREDDD
ncbi:DUF6538 domain-containing protein [Devosia sp.]|uniref:DUF6538 domain-containing protein n=1 Tax=Devosia sp. TaxID=1871048 RepID=UPI002EEE3336